MDERSLIYDWNTVEYDFKRDASNHPHGVWFDDETLRDGLQSPSARNPTIEQKIELLGYMEKLGLQKVDLGLPGAGPFHRNHIDAMLTHISENDYSIRPGAAVRTLMGDIEPLVEMQAKHEMEIQASAFLGTSPIRQYTEGWTMEKLITTMEKAVSYAVENRRPCDVCHRGHDPFESRRCEDDLSASHGTWCSTALRLRHMWPRHAKRCEETPRLH